MNPNAMTVYAELCGWTLAKAYARAGDAIAISSYLGVGDSFDRALASFAETYADQNEQDYRALREAVRPAVSSPRQAAELSSASCRSSAGCLHALMWVVEITQSG